MFGQEPNTNTLATFLTHDTDGVIHEESIQDMLVPHSETTAIADKSNTEKKDNEQLNDVHPHDTETGTESDAISEAQLNDNQPDNLPSVSPCDFNVNRIDGKRGSTDAHQQRSVKVSVIDFTQKIFSNDKVCEADNTSKVVLNETDELPPSHIDVSKKCAPAETQITLQQLVDEKETEQSITINNVAHVPLDFEDVCREADGSSEDEEPIIIVTNKPLKKREQYEVDMNDLQQFLRKYQDQLLITGENEDLSLDTCFNDQQTYPEEMDIISSFLRKNNPGLNKYNNKIAETVARLTNQIFHQYIQFVENTKQSEIKETSPKRRKIRDEVRENILSNAEKMKDRYRKRKRIKVESFKLYDEVSVRIPKLDRHKSELLRLPALIVILKGTRQPMYKLACEHGTIDGYFTASDLKSYPGTVTVAHEDRKISLREAAKLFALRNQDIIVCKCRKNCKTKRCICKRNANSCHSGCHSGRPCDNTEKHANIFPALSQYNGIFPAFGGNMTKNNDRIDFLNTCPVDIWLALLSTASKLYPTQFHKVIYQCLALNYNFAAILELVEVGSFEECKYRLALINEISKSGTAYNFYGTQKERFVKHIKFIMRHQVSSTCSNKFCSLRATTIEEYAYPEINGELVQNKEEFSFVD